MDALTFSALDLVPSVTLEGTAAQLRALREAIDRALGGEGTAIVAGDWCAPARAVVRLLPGRPADPPPSSGNHQ